MRAANVRIRKPPQILSPDSLAYGQWRERRQMRGGPTLRVKLTDGPAEPPRANMTQNIGPVLYIELSFRAD